MHQLILDTPARDFTESHLLGNGRLGACVYGELLREQVVLNESSVWSGSREDADRPGASAYLPEIRRLLRDGKNYEAQQLFAAHFTCQGQGTNFAHGTDVPFGCYQMLGRLTLSHFQAVSSGRPDSTCIADYRRVLDLSRAVEEITFSTWGMQFKREYLVSRDLQALCIRLTCDKPGMIDCSVGLDRDERFDIAPLTGLPGLRMTVQLSDGKDGDGVRAVCMAGVSAKGGSVKQEKFRVRICCADEAYIFITARTDLSGFMSLTGEAPDALCLTDLQRALATPWEEILRRHKVWYEPQYARMRLTLPGDDRIATTRELLTEAAAGDVSPALMTLYLNFARYQMICCSQADSLPANLQGLWSDEILTPWNGDWHLNAQQMIYWLVEKANLSDCHIPYLKLTEALVEPGRKTASAYYGARGWLAHGRFPLFHPGGRCAHRFHPVLHPQRGGHRPGHVDWCSGPAQSWLWLGGAAPDGGYHPPETPIHPGAVHRPGYRKRAGHPLLREGGLSARQPVHRRRRRRLPADEDSL